MIDVAKSIGEDLAASVIWTTARDVVRHHSKDDLATLLGKSLQDAIRTCGKFHDDIGKSYAEQIAKAIQSDQAKQIIRKYEKATAFAENTGAIQRWLQCSNCWFSYSHKWASRIDCITTWGDGIG